MNPISFITSGTASAAQLTQQVSSGGGVFGSLFEGLLREAANGQQRADQSVLDLSLGRTDQMHQVLLNVGQADLQFRLVLEVRNKLIEAYQEIQKMQV